ncbi:MAG: glycosyltransferase family 4 protein [Deltaproteobacteria bacterium]|nr:glycosyltransferase family 4 protein [Deltaproteobacteria bacterium]
MRVLLMELGQSDREKKQHMERLIQLFRSLPEMETELLCHENSTLADFAQRAGMSCLIWPESAPGKLMTYLKLHWKMRSHNRILLSFDQESLDLALRLAERKKHIKLVYSTLNPTPPRLKKSMEHFHRIDAVVTGSETAAKALADDGFAEAVLHVAGNGQEPDPKRRARRTPKDSKIVFVCSDSLEPRRGYECLIRALPSLYQFTDMPSWELRIAGGGSQFENLLALAKELAADGRLAILGPDNCADILRDGDILIAPAEVNEGSGLAVKEGWAGGLAVLCSDIPLHLELVNDGSNGRCFRSADPGHLAELMHTLALDKKLRDKLSRGGKKSLAAHSEQIMLQKYLEVFQQISAQAN